ncbi:hypothetical protein Sjap_022953 [Stephania japonica]|uniref:LOB domain-containing protein n=1 Tax=Stephania japonica TaxID=461633 RepID=A0AAP0HUW0_9MAGN
MEESTLVNSHQLIASASSTPAIKRRHFVDITNSMLRRASARFQQVSYGRPTTLTSLDRLFCKARRGSGEALGYSSPNIVVWELGELENNQRFMRIIQNSWLDNLRHCSYRYVDRSIIDAFAKRWHPETYISTSVRRDDYYIRRLSREEFEQELNMVGRDSVRLQWLESKFSEVPNIDDPCSSSVVYAARAYILYLLGCTLFANKSKTVSVMYLHMLRDVDAIHTFSWGSACLSFLYKQLGTPRPSEAQGYLTLVEAWIYERIPFVQPHLNLAYTEDLPSVLRWICKPKGTDRSNGNFYEEFVGLLIFYAQIRWDSHVLSLSARGKKASQLWDATSSYLYWRSFGHHTLANPAVQRRWEPDLSQTGFSSLSDSESDDDDRKDGAFVMSRSDQINRTSSLSDQHPRNGSSESAFFNGASAYRPHQVWDSGVEDGGSIVVSATLSVVATAFLLLAIRHCRRIPLRQEKPKLYLEVLRDGKRLMVSVSEIAAGDVVVSSEQPTRFSSVHKIFGACNITGMLKSLPVDQRAIAADCMSYEAERRVEDPVYGCVKIIYGLQKKKNEIELELAKARSEIVFHSAVDTQQQQQQQVSWSITDATQQSDQV